MDKSEGNLFRMLEEIDQRERLVDLKFQENDLEVIYSFFVTLRHSLIFWSPITEGEEGRFEQYCFEFESDKWLLNNRIRWWKVAACDAVGATVGAILGGGKGALVTGIGASSISIIMQW